MSMLPLISHLRSLLRGERTNASLRHMECPGVNPGSHACKSPALLKHQLPNCSFFKIKSLYWGEVFIKPLLSHVYTFPSLPTSHDSCQHTSPSTNLSSASSINHWVPTPRQPPLISFFLDSPWICCHRPELIEGSTGVFPCFVF